MKKNVLLVSLILSLILACNHQKTGKPANPKDFEGGSISVQGTSFVDAYGRQVILSGFNYVNKDPGVNYLNKDSSAVFGQFHKWGVNCLRLGLIWDGVEPLPGKYDEKYLDELEQKVKWANEHHVYVMLDMHQDLYSRKYSDGAPEWATLHENLPHQTGSIWSDAYLMSAAVQKSFDNFWANKPASDGIGVQDHYIKMWQHIAKRFAKYDNILGYDIMNEPFNGSDANAIMPLILKEYATMLAEETGKAPPSEQELMMIWANEKSRLEVLKKLTKADKYSRILDAAFEVNKTFESTKLQPMYQKAMDSIRVADDRHIIFLEHGYFGNPGIRSSIEPLKGKNGEPDKNQAYAAHGYDLLVDTEEADSPNNERVEMIFTRINETSKRLNLPVLVGEWGAFSGSEKSNSTQAARYILELFERFHFGNTYWAYGENLTKCPCFNEALIRTYPQFISGSLTSYSLNRKTGIFTCTWQESATVKAPTVIYISDLKNLIKESIKLTPETNNTVVQSIEDSNAGYLIIPVTENPGVKSIEFKFNTDQSPISIEKKGQGKTNSGF
jgi:endoglycosylceramidase